MNKLVLLNDVSTEMDEAKLLVGDTDPPASFLGQQQADVISSCVNEKIASIEWVFSSDAERLKKLVHKIRVNSKDQVLTRLHVRRLKSLRERSFGKLNRTPIALNSELFSHSRIKAEKGESVFECRVRVIKGIEACIKNVLNQQNKTVLVVSHPFASQIVFNALLQRDHTLVTEFWLQKGSFVVLLFEHGRYGLRWGFQNGYNALSNTVYTQDQIYSGLLGKEGSSPS